MTVKPITPSEVTSLKATLIPDAIFESFNEVIAENFDGFSSCFRQKTVVARIVKKGIKAEIAFANHWLDVEEIYEKAGWKVEYDKPGYNETYEATFTFKVKKKS